MFSPPIPSGTFTFASQCLSSWMSKDSTPGISLAILAGSFMTSQTSSPVASNSFALRLSPCLLLPPSSRHLHDAAVSSGSWIIPQTR